MKTIVLHTYFICIIQLLNAEFIKQVHEHILLKKNKSNYSDIYAFMWKKCSYA